MKTVSDPDQFRQTIIEAFNTILKNNIKARNME